MNKLKQTDRRRPIEKKNRKTINPEEIDFGVIIKHNKNQCEQKLNSIDIVSAVCTKT